MSSSSETGLQLFARLVARPSLVGMDDTLFPDGPHPKEVIEVSGEHSCGKTLLLSQLIVKCILPKESGGLQAEVVLLNTDHHFQVHGLVSLMESRLQSAGSLPVSDVEEMVKRSLGRLIIYNVSDSSQLQVTFHALQSLVTNRPEVALILLDSVCTFYWQDSMSSGVRKMDLYVKTMIQSLQRAVTDFKGVIMYTRAGYFQSKTGKVGCADCRVVLTSTGQDNLFRATVESASGAYYDRMFMIGPSGIQWLNTPCLPRVSASDE